MNLSSKQAADKQGMTPLHMAASHKQTTIVKMLIMAGVKLRCLDDEKITPLHAACTEGNIDIVKTLFKAAAKLDGWVTIQKVSEAKPVNYRNNNTITYF